MPAKKPTLSSSDDGDGYIQVEQVRFAPKSLPQSFHPLVRETDRIRHSRKY